MINIIQYNEMAQEIAPMPFLTTNLSNKEI